MSSTARLFPGRWESTRRARSAHLPSGPPRSSPPKLAEIRTECRAKSELMLVARFTQPRFLFEFELVGVRTYTLRSTGQFSDRHFLGVSGPSTVNKTCKRHTPNDGCPRSTIALSVLQIIGPPWFICLAVFVPASRFSWVSVYSTPPSTSFNSWITVQGGSSNCVKRNVWT